MHLQNKATALVIGALLLFVAEASYPIGKVGNNSIGSPQERTRAIVPNDFPMIQEFTDGSVTLQSWTMITSSRGMQPANLRAFGFRDRYPELATKSLQEIDRTFKASTETQYSLIEYGPGWIKLLGISQGSIVGVFVAEGGRGFVFVGINHPFIEQSILQLLQGSSAE